MHDLFRTFLLGAFLAAAATANADSLTTGSPLPELRLADQYDVEAVIGSDVRRVIFTRDMDAGNVVKEALSARGEAILAAAGAVYVAEISRMPALVTTLFAVPSMRKRSYRILLDRDGQATAAFPSEEGRVTVMKLDAGRITEIDFSGSVESLRVLLDAR